MKKIFLLLLVLLAAAVFALTPVPASAQGESPVSIAVMDDGIFVTVKETVAGDVLSLYRVSGDRIILVDTVVNTSTKSERDVKLSERYLHRLRVDNR